MYARADSDTFNNIMYQTLTIILPLPPRILSPNCPCGSRRGRIQRAVAARRYKSLAYDAAMAQDCPTWQMATVRALFYHTTQRRRDDVNHLAMLKPAYDGIVQAGLIPDDDRKHLETVGCDFAIDKHCPRVELTFTRKE